MLRIFKKKLTAVLMVESLRDISQHNWERLNETQEARWLFKNQDDKDRLTDPEIVENKLHQLHDEYANATGGFYVLEKLMILMVKRIEARAKVGLGDKSQKNFVNLYTQMIDQLMEVDGEVDIVKTRLMVQKAYGQPINVHETSAYEFAMITNLVKDMAAQTNNAHNG